MLDIKFIRENKDLVAKNNKNRGAKVDLSRLLVLDEQRRDLLHNIEVNRSHLKRASKTKPDRFQIKVLRQVGEDIKILEDKHSKIETEFLELFRKVPNLTHPDAPVGGEKDFKVLETRGQPPKFDFPAKTHEQLFADLDLMDFERGAKVAESKFYFAKGDLVRLNQGMINYGIDVLTKHGFLLMETPELVKNHILNGVGFAPRGPESNTYVIEGHDLSLIATAEIPLAGYHADEVIDLSKGPLKYAGLSHCFRTERGAYGRESKGLYRVHQFSKLEMFVYCKPEDSEKIHAELLEIEREIADALEIPYRVIDVASGDLGAPAYRKFDIEAWMTMKNDYGEITSASNCTDYQARRLNIKYKKPDGKNEYVHTLNGTAVVTSRFPIAIFENHQQKDGSIAIPKVLQKYFGKALLTPPREEGKGRS